MSLFFSSVALSSCASSPRQKPPEISYGMDACEQCRMTIDNPSYSAVFTTSGGQTHKFDDIGCMFHYLHEHEKENTSANAVYVANYNTKSLMDGKNAFFVKAEKVSTPMGYGIIAFENESSARAFALRNNDPILTYNGADKISQLKTETRSAKAVKK